MKIFFDFFQIPKFEWNRFVVLVNENWFLCRENIVIHYIDSNVKSCKISWTMFCFCRDILHLYHTWPRFLAANSSWRLFLSVRDSVFWAVRIFSGLHNLPDKMRSILDVPRTRLTAPFSVWLFRRWPGPWIGFLSTTTSDASPVKSGFFGRPARRFRRKPGADGTSKFPLDEGIKSESLEEFPGCGVAADFVFSVACPSRFISRFFFLRRLPFSPLHCDTPEGRWGTVKFSPATVGMSSSMDSSWATSSAERFGSAGDWLDSTFIKGFPCFFDVCIRCWSRVLRCV